jgi:hypothetical protein
MKLEHQVNLEKLAIEREKVQVDAGVAEAKLTSEEVLADAGRRETRRIEKEQPPAAPHASPTTQ